MNPEKHRLVLPCNFLSSCFGQFYPPPYTRLTSYKLFNTRPMRYLQRLTGIALIALGLFFLSKNILVTTNPDPYWWRGFMADSSILMLAMGLLMLVLIPFSALRQIGSIFFVFGVLCVFNSRYAVLTVMGMSELISAILAIASGYLFYVMGQRA